LYFAHISVNIWTFDFEFTENKHEILRIAGTKYENTLKYFRVKSVHCQTLHILSTYVISRSQYI